MTLLLTAVGPGRELSAPGVAALLAALARDLQAEFAPCVGTVADAYAAWLAAGGDRDAAVLEAAYSWLGSTLRALGKHAASGEGLAHVLAATRSLRATRTPVSRRLGAQAAAHLLRRCARREVGSGVVALLADAATAGGGSADADAAGAAVGEACLGPDHGLHSRAPDALAALLAAGVGAARAGVADAAAAAALARVHPHTRRHTAAPVWAALLRDAGARVEAALASPDDVRARAAAAAGVGRVADAARVGRGARVAEFGPLVALTARAADLLPAADVTPSADAGLTASVAALAAAVADGHRRAVGASGGPRALVDAAPAFRRLLESAPLAAAATAARAMRRASGGGAPGRALAPLALAPLARAVARGGPAAAGALAELGPALADLDDCPWTPALPLLLGVGGGLAAAAASAASAADWPRTGRPSPAAVAATVAASTALPHAVATPAAAASAAEACLAAVERARALPAAPASATDAHLAAAEACALRALAAARRLSGDGAAVAALAPRCVALLCGAGDAPATARAAADVLALASAAGAVLSQADGELLRIALLPALASPAAGLRGAALAALAAWPDAASTPLPALVRPLGGDVDVASGRAAAVAIARLGEACATGRLPLTLDAPAVATALGALHARFSPLWPAASTALARCLGAKPALTWPAVAAAAAGAQTAALAGGAAAARAPADADDARRDGDPDEEDDGLGGEARLLASLDAAAADGGVGASGGAAGALTRLSHMLKAVAAGEGTAARYVDGWAPLFLEFVAARPGGGGEGGDDEGDADDRAPSRKRCHSSSTALGARAWRDLLLDWLAVVKAAGGALRGARARAGLAAALGNAAGDADGRVQAAALEAITTGLKPAWMVPVAGRLARLADDATLRRELVSFPVASTADGGVPPHDRPALLALLARLLWPKMRRRSGRLGGKGAPGSARAACISFLAAADPGEAHHLAALFIAPLAPALKPPGGEEPPHAVPTDDGLFAVAWWEAALAADRGVAWWLAAARPAAVAALPLRVRLGFANGVADLLERAGHRLGPSLAPATALAAAVFAGTPPPPDGAPKGEAGTARDVRAAALRAVAGALARAPSAADWAPLWEVLLPAAASAAARLAPAALSGRTPPVLELAAALAGAAGLAPVLADAPAAAWSPEAAAAAAAAPVDLDVDEAPPLPPCPPAASAAAPWAAARAGSALVASLPRALAPAAAPPVRDGALRVLECVVELGEGYVREILGPHAESLLPALQALAGAAPGAAPAAAAPVVIGTRTRARALTVLEALAAASAPGPGAGAPLARALLPLVAPAKARGRGGARAAPTAGRAAAALAAVLRRAAEGGALEGGDVAAIAAALSAPLALRADPGDAGRRALLDAWHALALHDASLAPAASLLAALDAASAVDVGAPDYDARVAAYASLRGAGWLVLPPAGAAALARRALADVGDADDLPLRHAAAAALAALVAAGASGPGAASLATVADRVVLAAARRGAGPGDASVRGEHLALLRALALARPSDHPGLALLADADEELDFFLNAAHLQLHRRGRALARLAKLAPTLPPGTLIGVCMPIVEAGLLGGAGRAAPDDGGGGGDGGAAADAGHAASRAGRAAAVADAAVDAMGAVAAVLDWPQYAQVLGRALRLARGKGETRAATRALCAVVDAFHFELPGAAGVDELAKAADEADAEEAAKEEGSDGADADADAAAAESGDDEDAAATATSSATTAADIQRALLTRALPSLAAALVVDGAPRPGVGAALAKLLRRLPAASARRVLPRALQSVAGLMRSRDGGRRAEARKTFVGTVAELGPAYLPFALSVLASALPPKGVYGHVAAYTAHACLEALARAGGGTFAPGALDAAADRALALADGDLFGVAADEREAAGFGRGVKEARASTGVAVFELVAAGVTFRARGGALLAPLRARLPDASRPAVAATLRSLLAAVVRGAAANASATPTERLTWAYGLVKEGVDADAGAKAAVRAGAGAAAMTEGHRDRVPATTRPVDVAAVAADAGGGGDGSGAAAAPPLAAHLLAEAGLAAAARELKQASPPLDAVDALLPLLVKAVRSRHDGVSRGGVQCLAAAARARAPGLAAASPAAADAAVRMLRRAPSSDAPSAQAALGLLATLLARGGPAPDPAPARAAALLRAAFPPGAPPGAAPSAGALALFRALVARRVLVPELYDAADSLQDAAVRAAGDNDRAAARKAVVAFLLDAPLGPRRLGRHLERAAANLEYPHADGRAGAAALLEAVATAFPPTILAEWAPALHLPLAARLAGEAEAAPRAAARRALAAVASRSPPATADKLAGFAVAWMADGSGGRVAAGALALAAQVEAEGGDGATAARRARAALPPALAALDRAADTIDAVGDGDGAGWREAYAVLALLETLADAGGLPPAADALAPYLAASRLALYPHVWVRRAAARLVGRALASPAAAAFVDAAGGPRSVARAALTVAQDPSAGADEGLLAQAIKNLVAVAPALLAADAAAGLVPELPKTASGDEEDEEDEEDGDDGGDSGSDAGAAAAPTGLTLLSVARAAARMAEARSADADAQRAAGLKLAAALGARLGAGAAPYLPTLCLPLVRATEAGGAAPAANKDLALQVMDALRSSVGADALLAGHGAARRRVAAARAGRRAAKAARAVADPAAAARDRLRKQARRAAGRKRKAEEVARLRARGVRVKNRRAAPEA